MISILDVRACATRAAPSTRASAFPLPKRRQTFPETRQAHGPGSIITDSVHVVLVDGNFVGNQKRNIE
jgi:hypothetical protein